ncbi:PREDICTED: transmembrane protein 255B isoform X3 [Chinchilla lanigera]|uniref:transmembrane protein 255B isoform X3 n=1 Tax=Chinchilla lanigera TaxID=34839 RepID=UPI00069846A5|nr:PREDICTED: transmembrane protein 255B isoform X3 [Chinchilla lanigera]
MQPPAHPVPGPLALLDNTEGFGRRKRISLWFVGSLLLVSALILTIGLAANTRTENVTVGGYYPGIILGFGSFLGIIGIYLVENRRQMLVAAIVFISFGVVAAFCCAIVDGVFAARHMELRPLSMERCQFYSSGAGYLYDVYQTEVTCYSLTGKCQLKVRSNTCYCCDLYTCERAVPHLLRVRGCSQLSGCSPPLPVALGLHGAEHLGPVHGHCHSRRPGGLQGPGSPVTAGLQPVISTSDPLQPCPAGPGLHQLLLTHSHAHLLILPSASSALH